MENYMLQPDEVVLFQGNVNLGGQNGSTELILTNLFLVFIITPKKKFFSKTQATVEKYPVGEIKIYDDIPQIKQTGASVEIFLTSGEFAVCFYSTFEAKKFVNSALRLLTGKTMSERGADKFKNALGLVDDALGINTVGTAKNVLENGIARTLLGGFGKKSARLAKPSSTVGEVVEIAKEVIKNDNAPQSSIPVIAPSIPTDEQLEMLKKLKELVDMDVLTQDEFEAKKKQLLGL